LEDIRAYAEWAGKSLPTEEEWQPAAQGFEERVHPWGNTFRPNLCNGGASWTTTPIPAYPDGCSPFGCHDMCGNIWEMTESERTDGKTLFCILKGGSYFFSHGSPWYADGGPRNNAFAAKMLLSLPGLDRCATIGFRCSVDARDP
jgi:formylglycine-generating enzyme required for sulfatase activity